MKKLFLALAIVSICAVSCEGSKSAVTDIALPETINVDVIGIDNNAEGTETQGQVVIIKVKD